MARYRQQLLGDSVVRSRFMAGLFPLVQRPLQGAYIADKSGYQAG